MCILGWGMLCSIVSLGSCVLTERNLHHVVLSAAVGFCGNQSGW